MQLGYVLLQVDPLHADCFGPPIYLDLQTPLDREGEVILGYLISLHQVGVGVILPVELGIFRYPAAQSQAGHDSVFHRLTINHRQGSRQAQAHGTHPTVGRSGLVIGRTAAKHLAFGV